MKQYFVTVNATFKLLVDADSEEEAKAVAENITFVEEGSTKIINVQEDTSNT